MLAFVSEAMSVASPLFHEALAGFSDVMPVVETTADELRLTMHGRKRNDRDVGIRIYQFGTFTRLLSTLDPIERADTRAALLPPLRYAATPEWLIMRAEALSFEYGSEHFEIVLSQFLAQVLGANPCARRPLAEGALQRYLPGALPSVQGVRINTRDFFDVSADVELCVVDGWVQASTLVTEGMTTEQQRLRLNDHTMFFRTTRASGGLFLEGEFPGDLVDSDSLEWLATQIVITASEVREYLSSAS